MSSELINALKMVADEKSINIGDLIETIEGAVSTAAAKRLNRNNLEAKFNGEKGEFDLFEILKVCERVEDPLLQINADEALKIDDKARIGSTVWRHVEMEDLGRIAAQSVRQMIHKKGRELELDRLFASYRSRIGEMVTGRMIRKSHENYIFSLDDIEALLPTDEQLALDNLERGRHVKLFIIDVSFATREPLVIVSRSNPDLLRKLLELETPEIIEGHVEIVAVARDYTGRSKVAVRSKKPDVDAVGSCVGVRGGRIQPVVKELSGEKIDVFNWSDDPKKLISSALTPAKNIEVIPARDEKKAYAIAPDDQLSLAIGKKGVNVNLAVNITGWQLDVLSRREYEENLKRFRREKAEQDYEDVSGQKRGAADTAKTETLPDTGATENERPDS